MKIPDDAPTPVPTIMAVGVAKPKAHGQAITKTEIKNVRLVSKSFEYSIQKTKDTAAKIITVGTKIRETRSTTFEMGAFLAWACSTKLTIFANLVSAKSAVISTSK